MSTDSNIELEKDLVKQKKIVNKEVKKLKVLIEKKAEKDKRRQEKKKKPDNNSTQQPLTRSLSGAQDYTWCRQDHSMDWIEVVILKQTVEKLLYLYLSQPDLVFKVNLPARLNDEHWSAPK